MPDFIASDSASPLPPAISTVSGSQFIVIWGKNNAATLTGALFDLAGTAVSQEIELFSSSDRTCSHVAATNLTNQQGRPGGFAVGWIGNRFDVAPEVMIRRFNHEGRPQSAAIRVNTVAPDPNFGPSLASAPDSNSMICWPAEDSSVRAMMFDPDGAPRGSEIRISPETGFHTGPARAVRLGNNGFAVCWTGGDLAPSGIMLQILQPTGEKAGDPIVLDLSISGGQTAMSEVIGREVSRIAVMTTNQALPTGQKTAEGVVVSQAGNIDLGPFSITQKRRNTFVSQLAAAPLPGDMFVVTWCEHPAQDFGDINDTNIKMALCRADLGVLGEDADGLLAAIDVNSETRGAQSSPAVTAVLDLGTGEVIPVIVWMDDLGDANLPTRFIRGRILSFADMPV